MKNEKVTPEDIDAIAAEIRPDYEGKTPEEWVRKKMKAIGIKPGPKSVQAIIELIEEKFGGIRKAQKPRFDELRKRLGEKPEGLP